MDETKVVVPPEMLDAAYAATKGITTGQSVVVRDGLESAILWLDRRLNEMCMANTYPGELTSHAAMVEVWREGIQEVRRMFRAAEPELGYAADERPLGGYQGVARTSGPERQECHREVFGNKHGTVMAVVCSCGFATTYSVLSNHADQLGMRHFERMHEAYRNGQKTKA